MKIRLAYGREGLVIDLPDDLNVRIVEPTHVEGFADQAKAVHDALRQPIASKPLRQRVQSSDRVGVVINDITRATPYPVLLPPLLDQLDHVPQSRITLFNATGTHRSNTQAELRGMLGDEIVRRYSIVQNDCRDQDSHTLVGTTQAGNDIWIHKDFMKCDVKILTGFIEPHFFAGFSGGGKAVMPGLALLETVLRNHSPKNLDHPMAHWGVTEGNPAWEDIREAASMTQPTFLLNVTLNRDKHVTGVYAGDFEEAHVQGCAFARTNAMVPVEEPFDIVITTNSGYPLDLNLYQSIKGISAASQVVKKGGSIIAAADCWDGIPDHGEYGRLLREADSVESLLKTVCAPGFLKQDMWQAQIHALICRKADVYFYSENLTNDQIRGALLRPCRSVEAAVNELLERYGRCASICVLPEGPQTIPFVRGQ
ncbi:MAG: nickel-dependent lactate racemase [Phycisphaerales bacterium]|nr:MAG: nickel-dependent lactate racemase [Phycisphaerales bacterium]